jgi:glycine amidinotransferase
MKINSFNEWDKLREIIVGQADNTIASLAFVTKDRIPESVIEDAYELAREAYPQSLLDEVAEDLEEICNIVRQFGATVYRPDGYDTNRLFSTPNWSATGNYLYNMRDLHLVVGNTVIESASPRKHRYFESSGLHNIWYSYFEEGFRWITAPKPKLVGDYARPFYENGERFIKLSEDEILFDAANTVRMGKDLLYLVSASGNYKGAKWLQSVLGDDYRVHTTEGIYRSSHIDSTVICLRPGLVLLCADRVNPQNCPSIFDKWEKVYFDAIEPYPEKAVAFQENVRKVTYEKLAKLGVESDIRTMSSPWIGMNVLSLDSETVMVDEYQTQLIKVLEGLNFTTIPTKLRHTYIMKGGLHCCTLDTVRDGILERYFE